MEVQFYIIEDYIQKSTPEKGGDTISTINALHFVRNQVKELKKENEKLKSESTVPEEEG